MMHEKPEKKKKPENQSKTKTSPDYRIQDKISFLDFAHEFLLLLNHFQPTDKARPQKRAIRKMMLNLETSIGYTSSRKIRPYS